MAPLINDADLRRLAAILGMLGSVHAGERAAAGLQAEAFRLKHKLSWTDILSMPVPEAERHAYSAPRPPPPRPTAPPQQPPPPPQHPPPPPVYKATGFATFSQFCAMAAIIFIVGWAILGFIVMISHDGATAGQITPTEPLPAPRLKMLNQTPPYITLKRS